MAKKDNNKKNDLEKRLVEHQRWRWMPGMLTAPCDGHPDGLRCCGVWYPPNTFGVVPNLDDPATQGCLLAMWREVLRTAPDLADESVGCDCANNGDFTHLAAALLEAWE